MNVGMVKFVNTLDLKSNAVRLPGSSPGAHTTNEHINYFKIYARCYLMWSHSNMDRIVREVLKKDADGEIARKEAIKQEQFKNSAYGKFVVVMNELSKQHANRFAEEIMKDKVFMSGLQWSKQDVAQSG